MMIGDLINSEATSGVPMYLSSLVVMKGRAQWRGWNEDQHVMGGSKTVYRRSRISPRKRMMVANINRNVLFHFYKKWWIYLRACCFEEGNSMPMMLAWPFQYCYQLSLGAGFRPSLQPSWSPLIFPFLFCGGGALRYSVPKWLLFLN